MSSSSLSHKKLRRPYPGAHRVLQTSDSQPTRSPILSPASTQERHSSSTIDLTLVLAIVGGSVAAILLVLISFYWLKQYRIHKMTRRHELELQTSRRLNGEGASSGGIGNTTAGVYSSSVEGNVTDSRHATMASSTDPRYPIDRVPSYEYSSGAMQQPRVYFEDSIGQDDGSFVSAGYSSGADSLDEEDDTHNLVDEFDRYKDRNLERMKKQVEGSVNDLEDMMSHATMMALIDDDDDTRRDVRDLMGGTCGDAIEIEATILCEATDWLKRRESTSLDDRKLFMQDILGKMVTSVRRELLAPDDASRTIHECAALLGLQLSSDIPETTLMVSGMRQRALRRDLLEAFEQYGDIDDAAVSSNSRGFGIVRFKSPRSVQRALDDFRQNNLRVQDVFVNVKVLKYESKILPSSAMPPESEFSRQPSGDLRERKSRVPSGLPPPAPLPLKPSRESRDRSSVARSPSGLIGQTDSTVLDSGRSGQMYQARSRSPVNDRNQNRSVSRSRSRLSQTNASPS